jgi:hypothetical protein
VAGAIRALLCRVMGFASLRMGKRKVGERRQ